MKFGKGEVICREDLGYPEGALVCDGYDAAGGLLAHPLGGGFQLTVRRARKGGSEQWRRWSGRPPCSARADFAWRDQALHQIVHQQAEVQGRQHDQYGPEGQHRGKPGVFKPSLQEIERPCPGAGTSRNFVQLESHEVETVMARKRHASPILLGGQHRSLTCRASSKLTNSGAQRRWFRFVTVFVTWRPKSSLLPE
jgi:hypothetical protein